MPSNTPQRSVAVSDFQVLRLAVVLQACRIRRGHGFGTVLLYFFLDFDLDPFNIEHKNPSLLDPYGIQNALLNDEECNNRHHHVPSSRPQ